MIDTSTDTDVKQAAAQEFQRRNEASAELAKSAEHWTQEAVVRAKSEHLPPPSKKMSVSLQIPAYKEISSDNVLEHFDHLPAFLERAFEEVLTLDNPEQVELLVNINNPAGLEDEEKVGNTRSVQLLRSITEGLVTFRAK